MPEKFNLAISDNIASVDADFAWYAWKEAGFPRKPEGFLWNLWNTADVVSIFLICLSSSAPLDMYLTSLLSLPLVSLMSLA